MYTSIGKAVVFVLSSVEHGLCGEYGTVNPWERRRSGTTAVEVELFLLKVWCCPTPFHISLFPLLCCRPCSMCFFFFPSSLQLSQIVAFFSLSSRGYPRFFRLGTFDCWSTTLKLHKREVWQYCATVLKRLAFIQQLLCPVRLCFRQTITAALNTSGAVWDVQCGVML